MHDFNTLDFGQSKSISEDIASIAQMFKDVDCDPKHAALLSLADELADRLDTHHQEDQEAAAKKQEAAYTWAEAARLDDGFSEKEALDEQEKEKDTPKIKACPPWTPAQVPVISWPSTQTEKGSRSEEPTVTNCGGFARHVAKRGINNYSNEAPETLRNAFLQSINGIESSLEGFFAATGRLPPVFKQSATEVSHALHFSQLQATLRPCINTRPIDGLADQC